MDSAADGDQPGRNFDIDAFIQYPQEVLDDIDEFIWLKDQLRAFILRECFGGNIPPENRHFGAAEFLEAYRNFIGSIQQANSEQGLSEIELPNTEYLSQLELPTVEDLSPLDLPQTQSLSQLELRGTEGLSELEVPSTQDLSESEVPSTQDLSESEVPSTQDLSESEVPSTQDLSEPEVPKMEDFSQPELPKVEGLSEPEVPSIEDLSQLEVPNTEDLSESEVPKMEDFLQPELPKRKESSTVNRVNTPILLSSLEQFNSKTSFLEVKKHFVEQKRADRKLKDKTYRNQENAIENVVNDPELTPEASASSILSVGQSSNSSQGYFSYDLVEKFLKKRIEPDEKKVLDKLGVILQGFRFMKPPEIVIPNLRVTRSTTEEKEHPILKKRFHEKSLPSSSTRVQEWVAALKNQPMSVSPSPSTSKQHIKRTAPPKLVSNDDNVGKKVKPKKKKKTKFENSDLLKQDIKQKHHENVSIIMKEMNESKIKKSKKKRRDQENSKRTSNTNLKETETCNSCAKEEEIVKIKTIFKKKEKEQQQQQPIEQVAQDLFLNETTKPILDYRKPRARTFTLKNEVVAVPPVPQYLIDRGFLEDARKEVRVTEKLIGKSILSCVPPPKVSTWNEFTKTLNLPSSSTAKQDLKSNTSTEKKKKKKKKKKSKETSKDESTISEDIQVKLTDIQQIVVKKLSTEDLKKKSKDSNKEGSQSSRSRKKRSKSKNASKKKKRSKEHSSK